METLSVELVDDLRNGRATRERKIAVCTGGAHLDPVDRAEILAILTADPDALIVEYAEEALITQPIESFVQAVKRPAAAPLLFAYVSRELSDKPGIADALIENKNCSGDNLVAIARHLPAGGDQKPLLEDLDRVTESTGLAAALLNNPLLTEEQKKLLHELMGSNIDEAALADAAVEAEPDPVKRQTLLQRLAKMNVSQRVQFAIKGGAEARRTLIRDSNKVVQRAVLQSPRLTDQEVEAFCCNVVANRRDSAAHRQQSKFPEELCGSEKSVLNNAKTPLDVSLHMLPMLNAADLKRLTTNKNVPETLRTTSLKLMRSRTAKKG